MEEEKEMAKKAAKEMADKIKNKGLLFVILALVAICGISWLLTCGLVALITLCFGWTFKWSIATGIWLILVVLDSIFN